MENQPSLKIIAIVGPTASGKSALAVRLARKFKGEIISADSRQVYKGLDIGTAKITASEMGGIRHHLLDVANPQRVFTASRYKKLATRAALDIAKRGKIPIFCGGGGFYLAAALGETALGGAPPNRVRRARLAKLSAAELFAQLKKVAPERAAHIDRHNPRRLVRALELALAPIATQRLAAPPALHCLKIGLKIPKEELRRLINKRLLGEIKRGLLTEVKKLRAAGLSPKRLEELGLEYRYVGRHLRGLLTKKEMATQLANAVWQYAKRQMTWFKRDKNIHWVETAAAAEQLARDFLKKKKEGKIEKWEIS